MVIFVDWGSSNRRCYKCDGDKIIDEVHGGPGVLSMGDQPWECSIAGIRSALGCDEDTLVLMSGMAGSNRGWIEVPYVRCPAGLDELAAGIHWEGRVGILPGISLLNERTADVMRGEEMQILGALSAGLVPSTATLCTPGTHNKWVNVQGGRIECFSTALSGEMFDLLRRHSILSEFLACDVAPNPPFHAGVAHALESGDFLHELFRVRARVLLGQMPSRDAASYVSGLVIGTDIRGAGIRQEPVFILGEPALAELFAIAIEAAGGQSNRIDASRAYVGGMSQILETIR